MYFVVESYVLWVLRKQWQIYFTIGAKISKRRKEIWLVARLYFDFDMVHPQRIDHCSFRQLVLFMYMNFEVCAHYEFYMLPASKFFTFYPRLYSNKLLSQTERERESTTSVKTPFHKFYGRCLELHPGHRFTSNVLVPWSKSPIQIINSTVVCYS